MLISPRVYRPPVYVQLFGFIFGGLILALGLMPFWIVNGRHDASGFVIMALTIPLACFFFLLAFNSWVQFDGISLVISSVMRRKVVTLADLRGYRNRTLKNSKLYDLVFKDEKVKSVSIPANYRYDDAFKVMLAALPCLDVEDDQLAQQIIESDPRYGATEDERQARLKQLKFVTKLSTFVPLGLMVWCMLDPSPLWLCVGLVLALPWLAVLLQAMSRGLYLISPTDLTPVKLKTHGNLSTLPIFSAMVPLFGHHLAGSGFPLVHPVTLAPLLVPGLVIGLVLTVLVNFCSRGVKGLGLACLFVCFAVYGGGAISMLNSALDHKPALSYPLLVLNKHHTTGKGATHWLDVAGREGDPYPGPRSLKVDSKFYWHTEPSQVICGLVHPGAFGMAWEDATSSCAPMTGAGHGQ